MNKSSYPPIPALDGLRGFACILVFFAHAGQERWYQYLHNTGIIGVMLFFALSGFLMAYHYMPDNLADAKIKFWAGFLCRRFFRVYPLFAIVIALSWLAWTMSVPFQLRFNPNVTIGHLLLQSGIAHYWTIPVEIKFYAIFPLIVLGILFTTRTQNNIISLLFLLWIALLVIDIIPAHRGKISLWPYLSFFIGGMVGGITFKQLANCKKNVYLWNALAVICVISIILLLPHRYSLLLLNLKTAWLYNFIFSPLLAMTVLCVAQSSGAVAKLFSNHISQFFGKISYSLYLIHLPIIKFLLAHRDYFSDSPYINTIILLAICTLIAWLSYRIIEKPFNQLGKKLAARIEA